MGTVAMLIDDVTTARTLLFVPGDQPERFAKAALSGADVVIIDLEDAVAPENKGAARANAEAWLAAGNEAVVRINGVGTPWHDADLAALAKMAWVLLVPKTEHANDLENIASRLGAGRVIMPLIETPVGVLNVREICAVSAVVRPAFGSVDLAADLGIDHRSHAALAHARSQLVLASAAACCSAPADGVTTAVQDENTLRRDLAHALALGFTGKLCIHPRQIAAVHDVLAPSDADVRWTAEVVTSAGAEAISVHKGHMVDRPVLLRAQRLLDRAQRYDAPST